MCFVVIPLYHIFEVTSLFIGSYHFNTYNNQAFFKLIKTIVFSDVAKQDLMAAQAGAERS